MTYRAVAEHALFVYYDGDRDLARKVLDGYAHDLAEKIRGEAREYEDTERAMSRNGSISGAIFRAADLIDPEVSNSE